MTADDKTLERVRKLLALAQSDNPNEAAAAAAAAQRIALEHKLDVAALASHEATPEITRETLDSGTRRRPGAWREIVLAGVSTANGVRAIQETSLEAHRTWLVGRPDDIATTRYLYTWLVREIDRLTDASGERGRSARNAFRVGAASAVAHRLEETRRRAMRGRESALMRMEVSQEAVERFFPGVRAPAPTRVSDDEALRRGARAGDRIRLESGPGLARGFLARLRAAFG